jgi:MFS family permease
MNSKNNKIRGKNPIFYGYFIVIAAMIIMAASFGTFLSFGVFFKPILNEFGWSRAVLSGVLAVSLVVQGLLGILAGRLADKFSSRIIITIGGAITGISYLLTSQVDSIWLLYAFQGAMLGTGISTIVVPLNVTLSRWFIKRRALVTGIVLAGTGIGSFIVPPLAEWLISEYGWRMTYIIIGILMIIICVVFAQFIKRAPSDMGLRPDGAIKDENSQTHRSSPKYSLKEATRTSYFWIVTALYFCLGFYRLIVLTHLVPLITDMGISAAIAAWVLSVNGIFNIAGRITMGFVADKIGDRRNFIIGFSILTAAMFLLIPANEEWMFFLFAVLFGFAHAGIGSSEAPLLASLFGLKSLGLIYGVVSLGLLVGAALGPYLGGYIYDITSSYQWAFIITAIIGFIGILLSWLIPKTADKRIT